MNKKQDQLEKIKQHFGRRVHEQARSIVVSWNTLQDVHWNETWFNEFMSAADKLNRLASRYEFKSFQDASDELNNLLANVHGLSAPASIVLEQLSEAVNQLAQACSRSDDDLPAHNISAGRKPVYLCFSDPELAKSLQYQLGFFGIPSHCYETKSELEQSILYRLPAAIVVDTDFAKDGLALVLQLQKNLRASIPAVFYSSVEPKIETRLAAVRAHGMAFFVGQVDLGLLVERLISLFSMRSEPPFRVLVVDDSKAQAVYAEKTLNYAGIFTRTVNDPFDLLTELEKFSPDAILMDMYMPGCLGPELAQVIRQQSKYDAIPILYLSAESDVEKQLAAVGQGGDDFLTKPVSKQVLIATVLNRCKRHRLLREQLKRDSLTNLVDHNNTLEALRMCLIQAEQSNKILSFAMIDIDRFKSVNDTYGHGMGDRVIHALALFLRQRFRVSDTIGRYGGEEFAIVLPDTDADTAWALLDEVRVGFEKLVHQQGDHEINVTFSCGVASSRPNEDTSELAQRADAALYKAKANGRNRVEVS